MENLAKIYKKIKTFNLFREKFEFLFSASKKIRISLYKRIYTNDYSK